MPFLALPTLLPIFLDLPFVSAPQLLLFTVVNIVAASKLRRGSDFGSH
jgi:hypothetical protein